MENIMAIIDTLIEKAVETRETDGAKNFKERRTEKWSQGPGKDYISHKDKEVTGQKGEIKQIKDKKTGVVGTEYPTDYKESHNRKEVSPSGQRQSVLNKEGKITESFHRPGGAGGPVVDKRREISDIKPNSTMKNKSVLETSIDAILEKAKVDDDKSPYLKRVDRNKRAQDTANSYNFTGDVDNVINRNVERTNHPENFQSDARRGLKSDLRSKHNPIGPGTRLGSSVDQQVKDIKAGAHKSEESDLEKSPNRFAEKETKTGKISQHIDNLSSTGAVSHRTTESSEMKGGKKTGPGADKFTHTRFNPEKDEVEISTATWNKKKNKYDQGETTHPTHVDGSANEDLPKKSLMSVINGLLEKSHSSRIGNQSPTKGAAGRHFAREAREDQRIDDRKFRISRHASVLGSGGEVTNVSDKVVRVRPKQGGTIGSDAKITRSLFTALDAILEKALKGPGKAARHFAKEERKNYKIESEKFHIPRESVLGSGGEVTNISDKVIRVRPPKGGTVGSEAKIKSMISIIDDCIEKSGIRRGRPAKDQGAAGPVKNIDPKKLSLDRQQEILRGSAAKVANYKTEGYRPDRSNSVEVREQDRHPSNKSIDERTTDLVKALHNYPGKSLSEAIEIGAKKDLDRIARREADPKDPYHQIKLDREARTTEGPEDKGKYIPGSKKFNNPQDSQDPKIRYKSLDERTCDLTKDMSQQREREIHDAVATIRMKQHDIPEAAKMDVKPEDVDRAHSLHTNLSVERTQKSICDKWQIESAFITKGARVTIQGGEPATLVKDDQRAAGRRTPDYSQVDKKQEGVQTGKEKMKQHANKMKKLHGDVGAE